MVLLVLTKHTFNWTYSNICLIIKQFCVFIKVWGVLIVFTWRPWCRSAVDPNFEMTVLLEYFDAQYFAYFTKLLWNTTNIASVFGINEEHIKVNYKPSSDKYPRSCIYSCQKKASVTAACVLLQYFLLIYCGPLDKIPNYL